MKDETKMHFAKYVSSSRPPHPPNKLLKRKILLIVLFVYKKIDQRDECQNLRSSFGAEGLDVKTLAAVLGCCDESWREVLVGVDQISQGVGVALIGSGSHRRHVICSQGSL